VLTIPGNPSWDAYNGELRSNDTYYYDSWQDYVSGEGDKADRSGRGLCR
jgi:hypothetical protein